MSIAAESALAGMYRALGSAKSSVRVCKKLGRGTFYVLCSPGGPPPVWRGDRAKLTEQEKAVPSLPNSTAGRPQG